MMNDVVSVTRAEDLSHAAYADLWASQCRQFDDVHGVRPASVVLLAQPATSWLTAASPHGPHAPHHHIPTAFAS